MLWSRAKQLSCLLKLCIKKFPGCGHKHPVLMLEEGPNRELSEGLH